MQFDTVLTGWHVISLTAYCLACHFALPIRSPLSLKSCGEILSHMVRSRH